MARRVRRSALAVAAAVALACCLCRVDGSDYQAQCTRSQPSSLYKRGFCWLVTTGSYTYSALLVHNADDMGPMKGMLAAIPDYTFYLDELSGLFGTTWTWLNITRNVSSIAAPYHMHSRYSSVDIALPPAELAPHVYGVDNQGQPTQQVRSGGYGDSGMAASFTQALFQYRPPKVGVITERNTNGTSHVLASHTAANRNQCALLCYKHMQCIAGSYSRGDNACLLHYNVYNIVKVDAAGVDYFEIV